MKTLIAGLLMALLVPLGAAENEPVSTNNNQRLTREQREQRRAERQARRAERQQRPPAAGTQSAQAATNAAPETAPLEPAEAEEASLRLNFRGVGLDVVLDYLSEAAGYTIMLETPVKGTVDVWSNQALTKKEALDLLNSVLNKNGYAALQNGKTLTIVARDDAKKRNIPVKIGSAYQTIPKDDQVVTQVIPVRNINVAQLARDLAPLVPSSATVVANEGGNTLLVTDTQANIRRFAEIVAALDSQVSSASSIRVFRLKYADAKALATSISTLFQSTATSSGGNNRGGGGGPGAFAAAMFGGRGGDGGGGGGRGGGNSQNTVATATRVSAVADEHSNSVIVSAAESQFPAIELLINSVDTDVQDLTEVRVFHLKNADPVEMASLLTELFPDTTQQQNERGGGFRFGGGGGPGAIFGRGNNNSAGTTERSKMLGRVLAVADARTGSLVVSAARELMPQIAEMCFQLDSDPSKKKKVFVYDLENANVAEVETVLRDLFETQNTRGTSARSSTTQNNALQTRAIQANQNQFGAGTGGNRVGNTGGLGGGGGLGNR